MSREVSRRTSGPPEWKGATRPDVVGLKRLDESIVEDRPAITEEDRGAAMDAYLKTLDASDGPAKQFDDGHIPQPRVKGGRHPNG